MRNPYDQYDQLGVTYLIQNNVVLARMYTAKFDMAFQLFGPRTPGVL